MQSFERGLDIQQVSDHIGKDNDVERFTQSVLDLHASPERRAQVRRHNLGTVESFFIERCARRY